MNKPGKSFHTASSKTGRRIAAAAAPLNMFEAWKQTAEVRDWNAAVDEKNKQKLIKRLAKKGITA